MRAVLGVFATLAILATVAVYYGWVVVVAPIVEVL